MFKIFPTKRNYKLLQDEITKTGRDIQLGICEAIKKGFKKTKLTEIDAKLDYYRELIRECIDDPKVTVGMKQARYWFTLVDEIGKILGSWIKKVEKSERDKNYNSGKTVYGFAGFVSQEDVSKRPYFDEKKVEELVEKKEDKLVSDMI